MFLTIESARLPWLITLSRFASIMPINSSASSRLSLGERRLLQNAAQFVHQLARQRREIVDEIEWVLDLVGDAGGQLAERCEFLGLDETVLRLAQIVERGCELVRAGLDLVEQAHVLQRDDRLVGEGLDDLDLPVAEMDRVRHASG